MFPENSSRRQFLRTAGTAVAIGVTGAQPGPTDAASPHTAVAPFPIIDTHQHLWDVSRFTLPWHKGEETKPLQRSFLMSDYLTATKDLEVVKTVYMEVDVVPEQQVAEAAYVMSLCEAGDNPMKAAVISGRPGTPEFEPYIRKLAKSKFIKGMRQVLQGDSDPQGYCLQPKFVTSIKLLGDLGLSFDLCMRSGELLDAVKLVDQCPQTRFILDHCGNMSVTSTDQVARDKWLKGMKELAARPNVVCKVSGIIVTASKDWKADDLAPNINDTIDTFGDDRVMFAGDWPVCTLRASFAQWVDALRHIVKDRSIEFQRKLFHDNAAKYYGI